LKLTTSAKKQAPDQLKAYSTIASGILALATPFVDLDAQCTILDPPIVMPLDGNLFSLDLNNDGIDDVSFFAGTFTDTNFMYSFGVTNTATCVTMTPGGNTTTLNVYYYIQTNIESLFVRSVFATVTPSSGNGVYINSVGPVVMGPSPYYPNVVSYNLPFASGLNIMASVAQQIQADFLFQTIVNQCNNTTTISSSPYTNTTTISYGNWQPNVQNKYIGLEFNIGGQIHYGWVQLTTDFTQLFFPTEVVTLEAYGYNPNPGEPIAVGDCTPLAITLLDFKASGTSDHIQLRWSTATEVNHAGIELQRSSDTRNFKPVAWMPGDGDSNAPRPYNYDDFEVKPGERYYYRLKSIAKDGTHEFSQVISAKTTGFTEAIGEVFPNPATNGRVFLPVRFMSETDLHVQVFNEMGRAVSTRKWDGIKGVHRLAIPTADLNSGSYYLRVEHENVVEYRKLLLVD